MTKDDLVRHIAESAAKWTDLPVVCLRVGDYMEIAGYRYLIHIAHNNEVVLAPAPDYGPV